MIGVPKEPARWYHWREGGGGEVSDRPLDGSTDDSQRSQNTLEDSQPSDNNNNNNDKNNNNDNKNNGNDTRDNNRTKDGEAGRLGGGMKEGVGRREEEEGGGGRKDSQTGNRYSTECSR